MMMESPYKRRRIDNTRPNDTDIDIQISPIKIAQNTHEQAAAVSVVTTSKLHQVASFLSPARASSLLRKKMALTGTGPSSRPAFVLDGPTDENIFDAENIGREKPRRKGPSPPQLGSRPRQGQGARSNASHAPARLPASPVRSSRASSTDATGNKRKRAASAGTDAGASDDGEQLRSELSTIVVATPHTGEMENGDEDENEEENENEAEETRTTDIGDATLDTGQLEDATMNGVAADPELPTLPAQMGLEEMPARPQGLLSSGAPESSPSSRRLRRLNDNKSVLKEMKMTDTATNVTADATETATLTPNVGEGDAQVVGRAAEGAQAEEEPAEAEADIPTEPSGPIITWDVNVEREQNEQEDQRRRKAKLEAEVRSLQSGNSSLNMSGSAGDGDPAERERNDTRVLELLFSAADEKLGAKSSPKTPKLMHERLSAFLPFNLSDAAQTEPIATPSDTSTGKSPDLAQQLSSLTPFKISSAGLRLIRDDQKPGLDGIRAQRDLRLTSPDSRLELDLRLTVEPMTSKIVGVELSSSQAWVEKQLLSPLRKNADLAGSEHPDPMLVVQAATHFWELACVRASSWSGVFDDHRALIPPTQNETSTENIARDVLFLSSKHAELAFSWDIALDRTGRASSRLDAGLSCPQSWWDGDEDNALDGIGQLFHLLVTRQGVRAAVTTIVELVLGQDDRDGGHYSQAADGAKEDDEREEGEQPDESQAAKEGSDNEETQIVADERADEQPEDDDEEMDMEESEISEEE